MTFLKKVASQNKQEKMTKKNQIYELLGKTWPLRRQSVMLLLIGKHSTKTLFPLFRLLILGNNSLPSFTKTS